MRAESTRATSTTSTLRGGGRGTIFRNICRIYSSILSDWGGSKAISTNMKTKRGHGIRFMCFDVIFNLSRSIQPRGLLINLNISKLSKLLGNASWILQTAVFLTHLSFCCYFYYLLCGVRPCRSTAPLSGIIL